MIINLIKKQINFNNFKKEKQFQYIVVEDFKKYFSSDLSESTIKILLAGSKRRHLKEKNLTIIREGYSYDKIYYFPLYKNKPNQNINLKVGGVDICKVHGSNWIGIVEFFMDYSSRHSYEGYLIEVSASESSDEVVWFEWDKDVRYN